MAFTAADVTLIETSIRELATNAVSEVTINGRSYKRYDIATLYEIRDRMLAEVNAGLYGATLPVKFPGVTD